MKTFSFLGILVMSSLACSTPPVQAQFQELVRRVPSSANALVLINADKIFSSQIAKGEKWEADRAKRFTSGMTSLPSSAKLMVLASQFDLEFMQPIWEAAVIQMEAVPSLDTAAKRLGGTVDEVAKFPAIRLSDDSYVMKLSETVVGALTPANRQLAARWVREPAGTLSPYLQKAASFSDGSAGVIMALDLTDALTLADVQARIQSSESELLKGDTVDKAALARILASTQGVILGITYGENVTGKIIVDFGIDATPIATAARPLMLEILGNRGVMIDEFASWTASVQGTRLSFAGDLTASGLTRLSSLIELPTQAVFEGQKADAAAAKPAQESTPAKPQDMAQATQQYFKSIEHLAADLRGQKGEAKTIGQIGQWFDNYARKVDKLPLLNVDERMLEYGAYVASQLRNASMAIKGVGIRTRVGEVNAVSSGVTNSGGGTVGSFRYGGYGTYGYDYTRGMTRREQQSARTQVRANEKSTGAASVQQIRQQMQEASAQIRREMTQKYQIEF
jgi:hypothetical protein